MKSKFSLFIAVAMMFALVFAGCAGEEADVGGEVEPIDEVQTETPHGDDFVETSGEENDGVDADLPDSPQWEEGIYEYKGISFPGKYNNASGRFYIDIDFISSGGAGSLFACSFRAALAYIATDTEKLIEHFDNHEDIEQQLGYMEGYDYDKLGNLEFIALQYSYFYPNESDYFIIAYGLGFDFEENSITYVYMNTYLNENNEWKINLIYFTK
jgi:hypothetical protein